MKKEVQKILMAMDMTTKMMTTLFYGRQQQEEVLHFSMDRGTIIMLGTAWEHHITALQLGCKEMEP